LNFGERKKKSVKVYLRANGKEEPIRGLMVESIGIGVD
jgi:hypothetical protein